VKISNEELSMKVSFLTGAIAGAVVVTAGSAVAGYRIYETAHSAKVLSVQPQTQTLKIPRQECHDEEVTHTKPVKDQNRLQDSTECPAERHVRYDGAALQHGV
jgi:uncharacterized protein YcfJ